MSKTIMLDDKTYAVLKKKAKAEDRSISKMAKILISKALDSEERAAEFDTSPYSPIDWGSESDQDVERKPVERKPVGGAWERDMTEEELRQMSQSIRNKSYYNQEMSDDE